MSISIPNADYTPQLTGYTGQGAFRFWCQKVLPIVYDDSLSYYELLNKVVNYLNNVIADVASVENNIEQLNTSYVNLQKFVNDTNDSVETEINKFETRVTTKVRELEQFMDNYFDNLDVQQEINNKLDAMALDGSLSELLKPVVAEELSDDIPGIVTDWLNGNVSPTTPLIDKSLLISDAGADARITGYEVRRLDGVSLNETPSGLPVFMFERGGLNNGVNEDYKPGSRIRTKDKIKFNFDIIIGCKTGSYQIHYYDSSTGKWSNSEWVTAGTNLMVQNNKQFKILYTPNVNADESAEYDFVSMVENIKYSNGGGVECKSPYLVVFERGGLDSSGPTYYNWYNRARTSSIISLPNDIELSTIDGAFAVYFYDNNGAYMGNTDWVKNSALKVSAGENFKIMVSTGPNENVATELKDIIDKLNVKVVDYDTELNAVGCFVYGINKEMVPATLLERGSITNGVNDNYRCLSRIRTKSIQEFDYYVSVDCTSGSFVVSYYDENGTYQNNTGWVTAGRPRVIAPGIRFRVMYAPVPTSGATDYYNLADMVSNLKIGREMNTISVLSCSIDMERGNIQNGINDVYEHNVRARSVKPIKLPFPLKIKANYGQYSVSYYNDDGSYFDYSAWRTEQELVVEANRKFRLLVRYPDDSGYRTLPELCGVLNLEPLSTSGGYVSTPNIEFQCRILHPYSVPPESVWYVKDAAMNQYDRVRATVRVTTDGYLFNCHNDLINEYVRNPDGTELSEDVSASDKTLAELNQYDWGIKYGKTYRGAKVPMFEDLAKFAGLYNLNLTWHPSNYAAQTPENINKVITICDKYGLTDNLIVVTASGHDFDAMSLFKAHNKRTSYYIGSTLSWFFETTNIASINSLKTGLNKIYVQINKPWGSTATPEFIALAKENDWVLYDSTITDETSFFNLNTFSRGSNLIEVQGVNMIKSRLSAWVDSLVDTFLDG